jgi:hypothetical protein
LGFCLYTWETQKNCTLDKEKLEILAKRCTKPVEPPLNRNLLWLLAHDIKNEKIKNEIKQIVTHGATLHTDRSRWNELSPYPAHHPHMHQKQNEIYKKLIKMAENGKIYCDDTFKAKTYIRLFIKDEPTKKDPNKTRLIFDYKYAPIGYSSVNDLIPDEHAQVDLSTLKELTKFIDNNGMTQYIGKNDGESFYQQIPLISDDWPITVILFGGHQWIPTVLLWGIRGATKTAHYLSTAIQYGIHKYVPLDLYPCYFPYIDDHLVRAVTWFICIILHTFYIWFCEKLCIKLKPSKTVLASNNMIALGFQFDLKKRSIEITTEKIEKYTFAITNYKNAITRTTQETQQLIGKLDYMSIVAWPLRAYTRPIRDAIKNYTKPNALVKINLPVINMCNNWLRGIKLIKGDTFINILNKPRLHPIELYTDGSDIGFGIYWEPYWTFAGYWKDEINPQNGHNIKERELYPIAIACSIFGHLFTNKTIHMWCDNKNAVQALINKDIRAHKAHELVILICELAIKYRFRFKIDYIVGNTNKLADHLSRLQIKKFK